MAAMNLVTESVPESEIDERVISQAGDDDAWENPIQVYPPTESTVLIPPELASRATFLANLHRETTVETWITRIIQERIELEEAAFFQIKQDFTQR
jgi:hypothetical protein